MGLFSAIGMREAADELGVSIEKQIAWHLRANHYPPVPEIMVAPCLAAIEAWNERRDTSETIALPEGVSWRGENFAPAWAIIDSHHLDAWCESDEAYVHEENQDD